MIKKILKENLLVNTLGVSSVLFVILLWQHNIILTFVLFFIGFLMIRKINSQGNMFIFIFCGILGASAEISAIYFGVWTYNNSTMFGIPIWLIPLWGIAAIFMSNLTRQIKLIFLENK